MALDEPKSQELVQRAPADDWDRSVLDPGFDDEFSTRLKSSAEAAFFHFKELRSGLKFSQYRRVSDRLIHRFTQHEGVRRLAFRYGRVLLAAWVVDNIVSSVILPAVFLSIGQPTLAALAYFIPTHPLTYVSTFYVSNVWDRKRLERELRFKNLTELDRLKREILGFQSDHYLTTLLYEDATDGVARELGIDVVRRLKVKGEQAGVLSVPDLERIVLASGPNGQIYLDFLHSRRSDSMLYTAQLIRFCLDNDVARAQLLLKAQPRVQNSKQWLVEVAKLRASAERTFVQWDLFKGQVNFEAGQDLLKEIRDQQKKSMQDLGRELTRIEYQGLEQVRQGQLPSSQKIVELFQRMQRSKTLLEETSRLTDMAIEYSTESWIEALSKAEFEHFQMPKPSFAAGSPCQRSLAILFSPH